MNKLTVYQIGQPVLVANGEIQGNITQINIKSPAYVIYEVNWWAGTDCKSAWFDESQFTVNEPATKINIGFRG